jgi:hypothetical protein
MVSTARRLGPACDRNIISWFGTDPTQKAEESRMSNIKLQWPVDKHIINQPFGANPDFYAPFGLPGHEGVDLYAPFDANVYSAADGQVYRVENPPNHPYGLHIRIKHVAGHQVYRTIYAHLAKAYVSSGQWVKAGELIALADNSGNSFGSHLHLTLKIDGEQTTGYPPGIVDPLPYLQAIETEHPPATNLIVYPTDFLSLRANPTTDATRLDVLSEEQPLIVLGDADAAKASIGRMGEWIQVQTQDGMVGFVAAWFVRLTGQTAPASSLTVYPTDLLSVRARPSTDSNRLVIVSPNDPLTVLGDPDRAQAKIGLQDQWLNVRTPSGHVGYVAAWFVRTSITPPSEMPPTETPTLIVYPTVNLNLRAQPSINSPRVGRARFNQPLTVLEQDIAQARMKVGQNDQWLYVETPDGQRGWGAAWFLSTEQS